MLSLSLFDTHYTHTRACTCYGSYRWLISCLLRSLSDHFSMVVLTVALPGLTLYSLFPLLFFCSLSLSLLVQVLFLVSIFSGDSSCRTDIIYYRETWNIYSGSTAQKDCDLREEGPSIVPFCGLNLGKKHQNDPFLVWRMKLEQEMLMTQKLNSSIQCCSWYSGEEHD